MPIGVCWPHCGFAQRLIALVTPAAEVRNVPLNAAQAARHAPITADLALAALRAAGRLALSSLRHVGLFARLERWPPPYLFSYSRDSGLLRGERAGK